MSKFPEWIFIQLTDPRIERTKLYSLESIVFISIAGVVSGAETWTAIADFAKAKKDWLEKYIDLPNGTPSHDTIGDLFRRLDAKEFESAFIQWTSSVCGITEGELIAIDGKRLRGSYDKEDKKAAIHMVSAWASQNELVLGQEKVNDKSNEITAIPKLIKVLELKGAVVSIDAMGCQKDIAETIIDNNADYILAVKNNQQELYQQIVERFKSKPQFTSQDIDKGHGRIEARTCNVFHNLNFIDEAENWKGIKSIVEVVSERTILIDGKNQMEKRYYISSLKQTPEKFNEYIRKHWQIENKLHWMLDVNFKEDASRVRKGDADENFSIIRRIALNLIKTEKELKMSHSRKRGFAAWDDKIREKLLGI